MAKKIVQSDKPLPSADARQLLPLSDAIAAVSNALTETLELDDLLQLIVSRAQELIANAEWATIHLLQPEGNQLELVASAGLDVAPESNRLNPGEGFAGQVMAEGIVLNVPDVEATPQRRPLDLSTKARSLMVAPVESRLGRIGTISVQCATPSIFTPADERLLTVLGAQAGIAIENARLYTAQRRARQTAERQQERLKKMALRIVEAQEEERERIARELHDESGQALTSLKISLAMIQSELPPDLAGLKEKIQEVLDLTDKTIGNLRLLSHNLRPPGLAAYGLNAALEGLCQDFETHTPLAVRYRGVELPDLAELPALSLYRFAQEALTNVAKYAQASKVEVTLVQKKDNVILNVSDNGCGFDPPDLNTIIPAEGAGLIGMLERLEMVDGRLHIDSAPGEGARLTAVVPAGWKKS